MTLVYRLTRRVFAAAPFDGEGSYLFGGRWSSPGTRVVYTAEHLSLAMVEYLAHIDMNSIPEDMVLARAEVPDSMSRQRITLGELLVGWSRYPAPESLAAIGDKFVSEAKAAVLVVPSALARTEYNWLINPNHPDSRDLRIHPIEPFQFDSRLI